MIIILLIAAAISFGLAFQEKNISAFFEPLLILLIVILNAIMANSFSHKFFSQKEVCPAGCTSFYGVRVYAGSCRKRK